MSDRISPETETALWNISQRVDKIIREYMPEPDGSPDQVWTAADSRLMGILNDLAHDVCEEIITPTAGLAQTPDLEATVSRIMVIRNGMTLDGDAEALIRKEIGALMGSHAQRPTREAVEKALCCPKGCVRSDDCFVSGPPVRWSRSKHEREQADAILALCSPTVSDTSTDRPVPEFNLGAYIDDNTDDGR